MDEKVKGKAWKTEFDLTTRDPEIEYEGDFVDELIDATTERDIELSGSALSSMWSRRRRKHSDPEKVVADLMNIRETVKNLLKIHGMPRDTTLDIAGIGAVGAGAAGYAEIGGTLTDPKLAKPFMFIDKTLYESMPEDIMLDVYCGVGLHEASHLNHTRRMYVRLKSGELRGEMAIWEGLLEDERIEQRVREESPGYSPYLQAAKKGLFESKELGTAIKSWAAVPDKDKVLAIICSTLRTPYLLKKEHKEWKTLKGTCVFKEVRKLLPGLPVTEYDVEKMGKKLAEFWGKIQAEYSEAMSTPSEDLAREMLKKSGKLKEADDGSTAKGGKSSGSSGDSKDGDSIDSSDGEPSEIDDNDSESDSSEKKSEKSSEKTGEDSKKSKSTEELIAESKKKREEREAHEKMIEDAKKEIEARKLRQKLADEHDIETEKMLKTIAETMKSAMEKAGELAKAETSEDAAKALADAGSAGEAKAEKLDAKMEDVEKLRKAIEEDRMKRKRFSMADLKRMIDRSSTVVSGLDSEETKELAKAESERIEFGESWSVAGDDGEPGMGGSRTREIKRRTVIRHPVADAKRRKKYVAARAEVADFIARMKGVFRLRLGEREVVETELAEGKLHRKMLARASITDKVFSRKYTKTDQGLSLCLLLDESGSMGCSGKYWTAMKLGILIAEALKGVPGIELEVYSFTSCGEGHQDCLINYLYGKENKTIESIGAYFEQGAENYDHMAIKCATDLFIRNTTNKRRLMLVLSDGYPAGYAYGGRPAMNMTKKAVEASEKRDVMVMQVAIESIASELMFKHYVKFTDLSNLINQMRILITRIVKQSTKG